LTAKTTNRISAKGKLVDSQVAKPKCVSHHQVCALRGSCLIVRVIIIAVIATIKVNSKTINESARIRWILCQ